MTSRSASRSLACDSDTSPIEASRAPSIAFTSTATPWRPMARGYFSTGDLARGRPVRQFVHGYDGDLPRTFEERQRIVDGSRGFATAVPRDHHACSDRRKLASVWHEQHRPAALHDEILDEVIGDKRFGVTRVVLACSITRSAQRP